MDTIRALHFLNVYNSNMELKISWQIFFLVTLLLIVFFLHLIVLFVRTKREYQDYKKWVERRRLVFADMTLELMDPMVLIFTTLNRMEQIFQDQRSGIFGLMKKNIHDLLDQTYNLNVVSRLEDQVGSSTFVYGDMRAIMQGYINQQQVFAAETGKTLVLYTSFEQYFMDVESEAFEKIFHQFLHLLIYSAEGSLIEIQADIVPGGGELDKFKGLEPQNNYLVVRQKISGEIKEMTNFSDLSEKDRLFFLGRSNRNVAHLSLYIMDYLMDKLGGRVLYQSADDRIVAVSLFFPIAHKSRVSREATLIPTSKEPEFFPVREEGPGGVTPKNILVVESDRDYGQQLKSLLEPTFRIDLVDIAEVNRELLSSLDPGLVLFGGSKEQLPLIWNLCKALRDNSKFQETPILQLLDQNDPEIRIKGLKNGVSSYLIKPLLAGELLLHIKKLITMPGEAHVNLPNAPGGTTREKSKQAKIFLERLKTVIGENISNTDFRIEDLCKALHMSHSKLHRKAVHSSGYTPQQIIRQMRLDHAVVLLQNPDLNINEVALNTGFEDPGYFTRVFKREKGLTPTEFRESFVKRGIDFTL